MNKRTLYRTFLFGERIDLYTYPQGKWSVVSDLFCILYAYTL
jgi:hypothetical protein